MSGKGSTEQSGNLPKVIAGGVVQPDLNTAVWLLSPQVQGWFYTDLEILN